MFKSGKAVDTVKTNKDVTSLYKEVRITGDVDRKGEILSSYEALRYAQELNMDLVLVNDSVNPVICKIVDYKKHIFDQKKEKKTQERKQRDTNKTVKEVYIGPNIAQNDQDVKKKQIIKFLEEGHSVRFVMKFKGAQLRNAGVGEVIYFNLLNSLTTDTGFKVNKVPVLEGGRLEAILSKK